jgi:hypothetical protein
LMMVSVRICFGVQVDVVSVGFVVFTYSSVFLRKRHPCGSVDLLAFLSLFPFCGFCCGRDVFCSVLFCGVFAGLSSCSWGGT